MTSTLVKLQLGPTQRVYCCLLCITRGPQTFLCVNTTLRYTLNPHPPKIRPPLPLLRKKPKAGHPKKLLLPLPLIGIQSPVHFAAPVLCSFFAGFSLHWQGGQKRCGRPHHRGDACLGRHPKGLSEAEGEGLFFCCQPEFWVCPKSCST